MLEGKFKSFQTSAYFIQKNGFVIMEDIQYETPMVFWETI
jgi:hypothetical protein